MNFWFFNIPKAIRVILLFLPGINWLTEIIVRWALLFKESGFVRLRTAIIVTNPFLAVIWGWMDVFYTIKYDRLLHEKNYI